MLLINTDYSTTSSGLFMFVLYPSNYTLYFHNKFKRPGHVCSCLILSMLLDIEPVKITAEKKLFIDWKIFDYHWGEDIYCIFRLRIKVQSDISKLEIPSTGTNVTYYGPALENEDICKSCKISSCMELWNTLIFMFASVIRFYVFFSSCVFIIPCTKVGIPWCWCKCSVSSQEYVSCQLIVRVLLCCRLIMLQFSGSVVL